MKISARIACSVLGLATLAVGTDACSSGGKSVALPPKTGQAVEVAVPAPSRNLAVDSGLGENYDLGDLGTLGLSDGTILSHQNGCVNRFTPVSDASPPTELCLSQFPLGTHSLPYGLAQAPDGQIYLAWSGKIFAARSSHLTDLHQVTTDHTFGTYAAPIAARSDGTVLIADDGTLYGLKDGHVTALYKAPNPIVLSSSGYVDHDDTVWLIAAKPDPVVGFLFPLGDVFGINRSGAVVHPTLPSQILTLEGGDSAGLDVYSIASDGANGFYARAGVPAGSDQYVLHIANGQGTVVAASTVSPIDLLGRKPGKPFTADATNVPLYLPRGIVVRPGMLILAGGTDYAIAIGLPPAK